MTDPQYATHTTLTTTKPRLTSILVRNSDGDELALSPEEARDLLTELRNMFGQQPPVPVSDPNTFRWIPPAYPNTFPNTPMWPPFTSCPPSIVTCSPEVSAQAGDMLSSRIVKDCGSGLRVTSNLESTVKGSS